MKASIHLPAPAKRCDVLFIAGEHSGDQHAARVARDLLQLDPDLSLVAIGGPALAGQGVQLLHDLTRTSVVGLVEVLRHYGYFKQLFDALVEWIDAHRPRVVCMVDYPGFNLRLAERLRKRGISRKGEGDVVIYQYISPQIWAWKSARRFRMANSLEELGVIFPFEVDCYADTELPVRFVGHPFATENYHRSLVYKEQGPILLLPGSRRQAVARIFPVMLETWKRMRTFAPNQRAIAIYPDQQLGETLVALIAAAGMSDAGIELVYAANTVEAGAVLTSSGTMSLHCALAGIPGLIIYRAHPITYWLGKRLVKVPWLGIANILLQRPAYPEFIQDAAQPTMLAEALRHMHESPGARTHAQRNAVELERLLSATSGETAALRILNWLK